MTSNRNEYSVEDEKYFVTLDPQNCAVALREASWIVRKLTKINKLKENMDDLHD